MRIALKVTDEKTLFQIDPDNAQGGHRFTPCIFVAVYNKGQAFGETKPTVISTVTGMMTAETAGRYGQGLALAAEVCESAESVGLSAVFYAMVNATKKSKSKTLFSIDASKIQVSVNSY